MTDKALLCGINDYQSVTDLRGCLNDVDDMRKLLITHFKFKNENVRVLQNEQVVRSRLANEMNWLFEEAVVGDRLVFHYSGHGSQVADTDGDDSDSADEILCLHDMNFDDPSTYLKDDDLRQWTKKLINGTQLLVVLDSCHSGTGTRMMPVPGHARAAAIVDRPTQSRRLARAAADVGDPRDFVLARFVPPPPHIQAQINLRRNRGAFRRGLRMETMNHILLAACRDDQTAADAFINGRYNGAFTRFICDSVSQLGATSDRKAIFENIRTCMVNGGYDQDPQLEAKDTTGPLFMGPDAPSALVGGATISPPPWAIELSAKIDAMFDRMEHVHCESPPRATGASKIVYVHGICAHNKDFSASWWNSLAPFAPSLRPGNLDETRHEVLWSEFVNARNVKTVGESSQRAHNQLATELKSILKDRAERSRLSAMPTRTRSDRTMPRAVLGIPGFDCVDDFTRYMLNDNVRKVVLKRFDDVVRPLLRANFVVEILSHSWGTVVAYEGLRNLDGVDGLLGRVHNLFTVGSALSIGPVRSFVIEKNGNGHRPEVVERWVNLDADGDIVGGSIGDSFAIDVEWLNLDPVGCQKVLGICSPTCAHGSYFDNHNYAVNREIFGKEIERS